MQRSLLSLHTLFCHWSSRGCLFCAGACQIPLRIEIESTVMLLVCWCASCSLLAHKQASTLEALTFLLREKEEIFCSCLFAQDTTTFCSIQFSSFLAATSLHTHNLALIVPLESEKLAPKCRLIVAKTGFLFLFSGHHAFQRVL